METLTKVYLYNQEMAREGADVTSIPLDLAKSKTAIRRGGWL